MFEKEKSTKLTVEKLRTFEGLENINEKDALEVIEGLYELSLLSYKIYMDEKNSLVKE